MLDMISHIENFGQDYNYYKVYFTDGTFKILTEKQFYIEDEYYNGELALKVIN